MEVSIAILGESTAAGVGVASQAVSVAAYTAGQLAARSRPAICDFFQNRK
jgi:hypothetical protein